MKPLITPTVNRNGNSKEDLVKQLVTVMNALRDAEDVMSRNCDVTHGRNFQHLTGDAHRHTTLDANHAWGARRQALRDMHDEVADLALMIQRQGADGPTDVGAVLPEGEPTHRDIQRGGYPDVTTEEEDNEERMLSRISDRS